MGSIDEPCYQPDLPFSVRKSETAGDRYSELVFLERDSIHDTEKGYKLSYDPGPGIPRSNCSSVTKEDILFQDMRSENCPLLSFTENGFSVLTMATKLPPEDFYKVDRVREVYYPELQRLLKDYFQARQVEVLEHVIRKQHAEFPISTGDDYEYFQPTRVVHVDWTEDSSLEHMEKWIGTQRQDYKRIQCVNIWKPIRGPVENWPLALCDARTVDPEEDLVACDVVGRKGVMESYQVRHSDKYRWFFLSQQTPEELFLFRQSDTQEDKYYGIPHSGFFDHEAQNTGVLRESIETRLFIYH